MSEQDRQVRMRSMNIRLFALLGLALLVSPGCSNQPAQRKFASPDDAATALLDALTTQDEQKMEAIFGREGKEAVASGDAVADRRDREVIALAMKQSWQWAAHGAEGKVLIIGAEKWPFPVPLVKARDGWQFDSQAGKEEVLARRVGRNELGVIDLCRAFVDAQKQYSTQSHDGKPAGLFAQRLRSTASHQDGLYWQRKPGEKRSPLGDLVAKAAVEGYDQSKSESEPFRGYYFRILTAQGPAAPGGKKNYIVNGDMSGGFALLAYPAKYAVSGVMTFVVNQDGSVYQKDLGEQTATSASGVTEYNPDESWTEVKVQ